MGGCRCTYRNCTVKTDGKTHMFHYPVFEKVRCHQWLVNAHRLEFLDLKVSQLKNRVVCQHHFKEENFMNYKKDKLTFDAIPTENGPFCDPSKFLDPSKEKAKSYPNLILLEDIENEVIFNDKKANFSLKYGDFLTNGELMETSARYNSDNISLTKDNMKTNAKPKFALKNDKDMPNIAQEVFKPRYTRLSLPSKDVNKMQPQPMLVVPPYTDMSIEILNNKDVNQELDVVNIYQPKQSNYKLQDDNNLVQLNSVPSLTKVKILNEKKVQIRKPIPVIGKLEKVSPSIILNVRDKKAESINIKKDINNTSDNIPSDKLKVLDILDIEFDTAQPKNDAGQSEVTKSNSNEININNATADQTPTKTAQTKSKLTSERSAAIEKKRKFNMKMKDILENCLDKLDDSIKTKETSPLPIKSKKSLIKQPLPKVNDQQLIKQPLPKVTDQQVGVHLAKDQTLPSVQEYTIAYLDARMKSMEKALLSKIEQNSQTILELKDSFLNVKKSKKTSEKKYVSTQTNTNEDCYKKFLYREISQYLSPDSNSLIYEELFINKYSLVDTNPQRKKRKKYI